MHLRTFARIAFDVVADSRIQGPIALRDARSVIGAARDPHGRTLAKHLVVDWMRYGFGRVRPIEGETLERAALTAAWLVRAQDESRIGGQSYGYFPFRKHKGWQPAYPETTGYAIPTFLDYAALTGREEYVRRAIEMARFEMTCQMPSGAIYGGTVRPIEQAVPVAFNTGMVLLGFLAAYRQTGDGEFLDCARRAAEFLAGDIAPDGTFCSHGPFTHPNTVKTYTCLCAWPLWSAAEELSDERFRDAAFRVGDAALRQQQGSGWFDNNCLSTRVHAPLLHTIAYTLQGLLELGIHSGRAIYVDAVARALDGLLPHFAKGFLHGRYYADWQPAALSSCLTGSAQMAVVCYRLASHCGDDRYRAAADRVLNYLKALQATEGSDPGVVGGIGGSFPLTGAYIRLGFPGWAAKFYLDALIWQARFLQGARASTRRHPRHSHDPQVV